VALVGGAPDGFSLEGDVTFAQPDAIGWAYQQRLHTLVHQILDSDLGAWLVSCDPHGEWEPLLSEVSNKQELGARLTRSPARALAPEHPGGFSLWHVEERTAGELGSPLLRRQLQEKLDANQSFVLLVLYQPRPTNWAGCGHKLCWRSVFIIIAYDQLLEWGWQPPRLSLDKQTIVQLALQQLQQDPASWEEEQEEVNPELLLELLAAEYEPSDKWAISISEGKLSRRTIKEAGLPQPGEMSGKSLIAWRLQALAHLLVTQAHDVAPRLIPDGHKLLLPPAKRAFALDLLAGWKDRMSLRNTLLERILKADQIAALVSLLGQANAATDPFLSHAAERTLFRNTCQQLSQKSGQALLEQLAQLAEALERHQKGLSGNRSHAGALPWGELLRVRRAAQLLLAYCTRGSLLIISRCGRNHVFTPTPSGIYPSNNPPKACGRVGDTPPRPPRPLAPSGVPWLGVDEFSRQIKRPTVSLARLP
jgi:hypothetical protein